MGQFLTSTGSGLEGAWPHLPTEENIEYIPPSEGAAPQSAIVLYQVYTLQPFCYVFRFPKDRGFWGSPEEIYRERPEKPAILISTSLLKMHALLFCSLALTRFLLIIKRGKERFREEGETAKKQYGGGRKETKNQGDGRNRMKREKGECLQKCHKNV